MPTKPTGDDAAFLTWAEGQAAENLEPSLAKKTVGWVAGERPAAQYFNIIWRRVFRWLRYLSNPEGDGEDPGLAATGGPDGGPGLHGTGGGDGPGLRGIGGPDGGMGVAAWGKGANTGVQGVGGELAGTGVAGYGGGDGGEDAVGVYGEGKAEGAGVHGKATAGTGAGVIGESTNADGIGVKGIAGGEGSIGVLGFSAAGRGVVAETNQPGACAPFRIIPSSATPGFRAVGDTYVTPEGELMLGGTAGWAKLLRSPNVPPPSYLPWLLWEAVDSEGTAIIRRYIEKAGPAAALIETVNAHWDGAADAWVPDIAGAESYRVEMKAGRVEHYYRPASGAWAAPLVITAKTPAPSDAVANALTPRNVCKAWGTVEVDSGVVTVLDGFNVGSVTLGSHSGVLVTLEEPFSGDDYCVVATPINMPRLIMPSYLEACSFELVQTVGFNIANDLIDPSAVKCYFSFAAYGAQ